MESYQINNVKIQHLEIKFVSTCRYGHACQPMSKPPKINKLRLLKTNFMIINYYCKEFYITWTILSWWLEQIQYQYRYYIYIYHIYHIIIYIIYQISFIIYHISEPSLTDCHTTFLLAFSQDTHVEIGGSETYPIWRRKIHPLRYIQIRRKVLTSCFSTFSHSSIFRYDGHRRRILPATGLINIDARYCNTITYGLNFGFTTSNNGGLETTWRFCREPAFKCHEVIKCVTSCIIPSNSTLNWTKPFEVRVTPFLARFPFTAAKDSSDVSAGSVSSSLPSLPVVSHFKWILSKEALKVREIPWQTLNPTIRKVKIEPNFVHLPGAGTSGCDERSRSSKVSPAVAAAFCFVIFCDKKNRNIITDYQSDNCSLWQHMFSSTWVVWHSKVACAMPLVN